MTVQLSSAGEMFRNLDRCPLCRAFTLETGPRLEYDAADCRAFMPEALQESLAAVEFRLIACRTCGFRFTSPQIEPERLSELYNAADREYYVPLAEASEGRKRVYRTTEKLLHERGVRGGRLLDVGCGTGEALRHIDRSFETFGVEPSEYAARHAAEHAGAQVHRGDLISARYPSGFFDAVTAFDVLEHLANPLAMLLEIRRILRPEGTLVIETGDVLSLNARVAGDRWYYVLLPGHVSFFSRQTMSRALTDSGYGAVSFSRTHHGEVGAQFLVGYFKLLFRHVLVRTFGERALALPIFRSDTLRYRIPFFYDHMLVSAVTTP